MSFDVQSIRSFDKKKSPCGSLFIITLKRVITLEENKVV